MANPAGGQRHLVLPQIRDNEVMTAGSLSDVQKILLGAAIAIGVSIFVEFAKPFIAQQVVRRQARKKLLGEFMYNLMVLAGFKNAFASISNPTPEEEKAVLMLAVVYGLRIRHPRFDFYIDKHPNDLYDLDFFPSLDAIYSSVAYYNKRLEEKERVSVEDLANALREMVEDGQKIMSENGVRMHLEKASLKNLYDTLLRIVQRPEGENASN